MPGHPFGQLYSDGTTTFGVPVTNETCHRNPRNETCLLSPPINILLRPCLVPLGKVLIFHIWSIEHRLMTKLINPSLAHVYCSNLLSNHVLIRLKRFVSQFTGQYVKTNFFCLHLIRYICVQMLMWLMCKVFYGELNKTFLYLYTQATIFITSIKPELSDFLCVVPWGVGITNRWLQWLSAACRFPPWHHRRLRLWVLLLVFFFWKLALLSSDGCSTVLIRFRFKFDC